MIGEPRRSAPRLSDQEKETLPAMPQRTEQTGIVIERIGRTTIDVPIVGVSPVIPHKWSEKALRMMRDAQSGSKARAKKEPKVPKDEAEGSLYRLPDGRPGFPATGLKSGVFVEGEGPDQLIPLEGEMTLREDTPRNANGVADLRYRYAFFPWSATLRVTFLQRVIDADSVYALVDAAGNGGVGDWRPSAPKSQTGTFGRFEVPMVEGDE
jgi:hypothetical protein